MDWIADFEYDLMSYCIKMKGKWLCSHISKWWCLHIFRNKEVNDLYHFLKEQDLGTIIAILGDGGPDYQKHIDIGKRLQVLLSNKNGLSSSPLRPLPKFRKIRL